MKKIIILSLLITIVTFSNNAIAQGCTNTAKSPSNTVYIFHSCANQVVEASQFIGAYSVLNLAEAVTGDQYIFSSSIATDFLTLRDESGNYLASGITPLIFTQPAIVVNNVQLHTNSNSACGKTGSRGSRMAMLYNNCPPPPTNNECITAATLPVNTNNTCALTTLGVTVDATQSMPPCTGTKTVADVWYKFIATAQVQKIIVNSTTIGGIVAPEVQLFQGTCSNLVSLKCNTASTLTSNSFVSPPVLIIGNTYFVRVYSSSGIGAFNICITTPNLVNDNCTGAITLPVNANSICTATTSGTTVDATEMNLPCTGTKPAEDVWYRFVATAQRHKIIVNSAQTGGILSPTVELFNVLGDCAGLISMKCNGATTTANNTFITPDLTIGTAYWIRIYSYDAVNKVIAPGAFTICVTTPPIITNDNCSGAITLPVNSNNTCTVITTGSTEGATQSQTGCIGSADDDVWYSFVATATMHKILVSTSPIGGLKYPTVEVFSGACGSLNSLQCKIYSDSRINAQIITGLTIGNIYWVRVYSYYYGETENGEFSICVRTPPIIVNDNCSGAIQLTVNANSTCTAISFGNTEAATQSQSQLGCGGTNDDDVWYSFEATAAIHKILVNASSVGGLKKPAVQVFSGTCGSLTSLQCNANSDNRINTQIINGLTIGNTYWVRVYSTDFGVFEAGEFSICVSTIAANESCETAPSLTVSASTIPIFISDSTIFAVASANQTSCIAQAFKDVWYKFTVTNTRNIIKVLPLQNNSSVYTSILTGTCAGGFISKTCGGSDTTFSLSDWTVGQEIYIRIHGANDLGNTAFKIAVITDNALNDECTSAYNLSIAAGSNTAAQYHNSAGATESMPVCTGSGTANDVWFKLTAGTKSFAIEIDHLQKSNLALQLFKGSCGTLLATACQDIDNLINIENPVAGTDYYFRLYNPTGAAFDYFIKAYEKEVLQQNTVFDTSCLYTNIAPNAGFESFDICPTDYVYNVSAGQTLVTGWTFPTNGTSDFLNSCSNFSSNVEVPGNSCFGKQSPRTGKGYVGLYNLTGGDFNYREYIQTQLPTPLTIGKRYLISYYVNLGNMSNVATNNLGVFFSPNITAQNTLENLNLIPQVVSPASQYFYDKENWVNVSAIFTADAAHQYFIIGNFKDNAKTSIIDASFNSYIYNQLSGCVSTTPTSYLYLDDITISEINETAVTNGCNVVLPLTLTNFDAVKRGSTALLNWTTVYELNTRHFEIERSANGRDFYKLGIVKAGGNTGSTIKNYAFTDLLPLNSINYYRLRMVDIDGKYKYSDIRLVRFNDVNSIAVFPNPAKNQLAITGINEKGVISIYALDGKQLIQKNTTGQSMQLDITNFAAGTYILQYLNKNEVQTIKVIKQ